MSEENPTKEEIAMALEDADFVVSKKGWNQDRDFKILAAALRLKEDHLIMRKTENFTLRAELDRTKAELAEYKKSSEAFAFRFNKSEAAHAKQLKLAEARVWGEAAELYDPVKTPPPKHTPPFLARNHCIRQAAVLRKEAEEKSK